MSRGRDGPALPVQAPVSHVDRWRGSRSQSDPIHNDHPADRVARPPLDRVLQSRIDQMFVERANQPDGHTATDGISQPTPGVNQIIEIRIAGPSVLEGAAFPMLVGIAAGELS